VLSVVARHFGLLAVLALSGEGLVVVVKALALVSLGPFAAEVLNAFLVNALNDNAANYGAWHSDVAKTPEHDCLYLRGGGVQDGVSDVVARKDSSDLSAIRTPPRIVHGDALAAAHGRNRTGATQHSCC